MATTYQQSSPYYATQQKSTYLGYWNPPAISPSVTDTVIQVAHRHQNRPDLLSYDLYGTTRLWWVFAMINPDQIRDPIYDLIAGIYIYAPSNTSVQAYI